MENKNTIDVVIPTYNHADFICEAIDSVLEQTFPAQTIFVIDNGSTDSTQEIIQNRYSHIEKVKYIYKKEKGLSAARNTGIELSQSPYIAFLDADDIWEKDKLEKQIQVFLNNPKIGVVYCINDLIDERGKPTTKYITKQLDRTVKGYIYQKILMANKILGGGSGILIKKECFTKAGIFDEKIQGTEEWEMWLRIAYYYEFDYVDEILVHSRRTGNNMSSNEELMLENFIKVYNKIILSETIPNIVLQNIRQKYYLFVISNCMNWQSINKINRSFNKELWDQVFHNKTLNSKDFLTSLKRLLFYKKKKILSLINQLSSF